MSPLRNVKSKPKASESFRIVEPGPLSFVQSIPASLKWTILGLVATLAISSIGLALLKGSRSSLRTAQPVKETCSGFFQPGKTLFWTIQDHGKPGNAGTLQIVSVDSKSGNWSAVQVVKTKNNARTKLTGKFEGSTVLISHPSQVETWFGACDSQKIAGLIKTSYASQLKFEIWK
jgi:hypothetical protein